MREIVRPLEFPIAPARPEDHERLSDELAQLCASDPHFGVVASPDGGFVLAGTSEARLVGAVDALRKTLTLTIGEARVAYRETIVRKAVVDRTHKQARGGEGEFARVKLVFEPLPRGDGFEFANDTVGGSVPKDFAEGVERGIRSAMERGVVAGYPTIDFSATLIDGAFHEVDSSAETFEIAAQQAFEQGMNDAWPVVLEPVMAVEMSVPLVFVRDVAQDFERRRGHISSREVVADQMKFRGLAPLINLLGYDTAFRFITNGQGVWSSQFAVYAVVDDGPNPPRFPGVLARRKAP
jgi:elongation factor G